MEKDDFYLLCCAYFEGRASSEDEACIQRYIESCKDGMEQFRAAEKKWCKSSSESVKQEFDKIISDLSDAPVGTVRKFRTAPVFAAVGACLIAGLLLWGYGSWWKRADKADYYTLSNPAYRSGLSAMIIFTLS
ncbi:MAG: hypothetical protein IJQ93_11620 [Bacteroidales bacterium]|nr:hypothetical protein [Bacteroidales bacterium]